MRLFKRFKFSYSDFDDIFSFLGDSLDNIFDSNDDSVLIRIVIDKRIKCFICKLFFFIGEGKEKWFVWKSCFEIVVSRFWWLDEEKLDEFLLKLYGEVGEFVFD